MGATPLQPSHGQGATALPNLRWLKQRRRQCPIPAVVASSGRRGARLPLLQYNYKLKIARVFAIIIIWRRWDHAAHAGEDLHRRVVSGASRTTKSVRLIRRSRTTPAQQTEDETHAQRVPCIRVGTTVAVITLQSPRQEERTQQGGLARSRRSIGDGPTTTPRWRAIVLVRKRRFGAGAISAPARDHTQMLPGATFQRNTSGNSHVGQPEGGSPAAKDIAWAAAWELEMWCDIVGLRDAKSASPRCREDGCAEHRSVVTGQAGQASSCECDIIPRQRGLSWGLVGVARRAREMPRRRRSRWQRLSNVTDHPATRG